MNDKHEDKLDVREDNGLLTPGRSHTMGRELRLLK